VGWLIGPPSASAGIALTPKCFLDMLGVFAEFETNLRRERQAEGIAKAKAAGVYKGRLASIDAAAVLEMKAAGMGPPLRSPRRSISAVRACIGTCPHHNDASRHLLIPFRPAFAGLFHSDISKCVSNA
jgi:Resolvase, N terminal domain